MSSVDVIIPCYRYAHYLEACVNSVTAQRGVDLRVLIMDDCSPDNTPEVAARLVASDPRVSYVRNEKNLGLIGTANRGVIEWAQSDYTLLLSADDFLTPDALARAVFVMDRHPDVHLAYGQALIVTDDRPITIRDGMTPTYQIVSGADFLKRSCEVGTPAPSPSVLVRTSMQKRVGGYLQGMPHTSDMEMWMRFAVHGPIGVIREVQAGYRWHGANMTLAYTNTPVNDRRERIATCEHVYTVWGGDSIPGFAKWISDMKRRYAREALYGAGRAFENGDDEGFQACLAFVKSYAPELMQSQRAWRLKVKRLLGPTAARSMRIGLDRLLGRNVAGEWFRHDTEMGWWPQPDFQRPGESIASSSDDPRAQVAS